MQTDPSGIVPDDLYQVGAVTTTDDYPPFTKKLDVCGITLVALSSSLMTRLDGFESQASITIQTANPAAVCNCLFEFKIIRIIFKLQGSDGQSIRS